jgi:hypothetical protein
MPSSKITGVKMPSPPFYLQISDEHGVIIRTRAGGKHEADLIDLCVQNIMPRGVGVFRTSKHVEQDIRDGIAAAIYGLKIQNPMDVEEHEQ